MDEILKTVILGAPNFIGFIVASYFIYLAWKQEQNHNEKLQAILLEMASNCTKVQTKGNTLTDNEKPASH